MKHKPPSVNELSTASATRACEALADQFLQDGAAVSQDQAYAMAVIALAPELCPEAKLGLLHLAHRKGADFDAAALSDEDIKEATDFAVQVSEAIALSIAEPMGSA